MLAAWASCGNTRLSREVWQQIKIMVKIKSKTLGLNRARGRFAVALACFLLAVLGTGSGGEPAMRVVKAPPTFAPLITNGDFEVVREGSPAGWRAAPQGFRLAPGEGRAGSAAVCGENATGNGWYGVSQTVTLNQTRPTPVSIWGWSKAQGVEGTSDSGYALYVDIVYADDTPLWGQTGKFRCGTHDWERREFVVVPEKPVKTLTIHCLFRGHRGKVWFDDVQAGEIRTEQGTTLFQGAAVQLGNPVWTPPRETTRSFATRDSLRLKMGGVAVAGLRAGFRQWAAQGPSGFLARDVATNSDVYGFENGQCGELGLKLETEFRANANHIVVAGRVSDTTGKDRAVTLVFALPVDALGWHWGDDIHRQRVIQSAEDYLSQVTVDCGATGSMSLYPLGAIWNERVGFALGLDMAQPAVYRLGYHAGTKQFYVAYDFGLVKDTERFPGGADFRFVIYRFEPRWGFRAAFQKYTEIFPDYFAVRSKTQGIWMPFTDVSKVQAWQDFGFRYHEGNNNVSWDDAHGVLSFRYTEPMTWWMAMDKSVARTPASALAVRDELARGTRAETARMAEVSRAAAMQDEEGNPALTFQDTPWCNGAVWSLNPNPYLPANPNGATVHWSEAIQDRLYGANAKGDLDGEYLDSLEGYVTANLNFRREHFRNTTVPLVFSSDTHQPALFKGLAVAEFTRWIAGDVHRRGKLMFANGVPYRFSFLCPWLDVLGTETDWWRGDKYEPVAEATLDLWRTMSGAKPYLLLMNTDYEKFTPAMVEKYFQRALFYGMWPSMFSHNAADNPYWQNPKWYNRDRALFKQYLPLVRRVAEAGWQPVTGARTDNDSIRVERFGPNPAGQVYYTLFNKTDRVQTGRLSIEIATTGRQRTATNQVTGQLVSKERSGWQVTLEPQAAAVLEFRARR